MENYNRSHRYRDDDRSSSNERNYDNNWDRTYNRSSEDWRDNDYENRNVYSSDHERDYWKNRNSQLNDLNWNTNRNYNRDYNNDYNRNYNNDSNRNYSDYNRNYSNDYNRNNDYNRSNYRSDNWRNNNNDNWRNNNSGTDNNRYRNEGWRDNNRNEDRDWWDRTKDEVASWFGDDDAQRRRDRDEREQGKHRGKGPKNYTRSQERIKEDVSDKLSDDSFLDASEIEVEVNGNEVTLTGQVDSRYSKHRAEDLAEDVTGVSHVQNNLRVKETTPQENRDNPKYNPVTSASANATKNKKETTKV